MRAWHRTPENDPYYAGSQDLAIQLCRVMGCEVIVGFDEFCAPSLDEAFDEAMARDAEQGIVVTPMLTRGGEESEVDIPNAIQHAHERYPDVLLNYAWPFDMMEAARFLATHAWRSVQAQCAAEGLRREKVLER